MKFISLLAVSLEALGDLKFAYYALQQSLGSFFFCDPVSQISPHKLDRPKPWRVSDKLGNVLVPKQRPKRRRKSKNRQSNNVNGDIG